MKGSKVLLISLLTSACCSVVVYFVVAGQQKKIGVVDAVKLFDQFDMKKELETRAKEKLVTISRQADSIGNQLQMAKAAKNEDDTKRLTYAYTYAKSNLENEYKQSNQDINQQVWKRLNVMVDEYGKQKGLHLIIGANGMGSVLYEDGYYDLTDDLIKHVNKKYEQGN